MAEVRDPASEAPIGVASWPHWYRPNPYMSCFYEALERHGIRHVRDRPLAFGALASAPRSVHALHLHWAYPYWRDRRPVARRLYRAARLGALLLRLRRRGMPVVWTVHNLEHHEGPDLSDRLAARLLHRLADLRIFTSEWARGSAVSRYGGGETLVVPIGDFAGALPAPSQRERVRAELGVGPRGRLLLCFGQVRPYKGFDVAARALERLDDRHRLVIAGRPLEPHAERLRRLAGPRSELRLRDLEERELVELIGASDAVLLPYRRVTGSAALLTALSLGRGVVASDLPYFREVVGGRPAAVLVDPGSPDALARGIERFFGEAGGPAARGEAARAVAAELDWDRLVAPVARWIERRVRGPRASPG